jgi:hypothetical protein
MTLMSSLLVIYLTTWELGIELVKHLKDYKVTTRESWPYSQHLIYIVNYYLAH